MSDDLNTARGVITATVVGGWCWAGALLALLAALALLEAAGVFG